MKGDFSRRTFDPIKHFDRVRMQQGRVQLDADFNEQADIGAYRLETATRDVVGPSGGPLHDAAFGVVGSLAGLPAPELDFLAKHGVTALAAGDFLLGPGRYYVDGILCESEHYVPFSRQPDFPAAAPVTTEGLYVLYLDVWRRHITAREDSLIREVALGGPDTTTRSKIVWQAKLWKAPATAGNCLTAFSEFDALVAPGTGRLSAEAKPAAANDAPCIVTPAAGYRGLENQLYRVEIHTGGLLADATFKWSRDNGTIVTTVEKIDVARREITVHDLGRDAVSGFAPDQWVELLSDATELDGQPREGQPFGQPGQLLQIESIDEAKRIITVKTAPAALPISDDGTVRVPQLRRWDQVGPTAKATGVDAGNGTTPIELELGIQIRLSTGTYRSGDYWLIPARTANADAASGSVEWPIENGKAVLRPPAGTVHHISRIAMLRFDAAHALTASEDCRKLFPPVTELTSLFHIAGDGQEAMPDLTQPAQRVKLPKPLAVGVANGRWPVAGARVRFTLVEGNGELRRVGSATGQALPLDVTTGPDGQAACEWLLDGTKLSQQVEARLLDVADQPIHLPVRFNANLSVAAQVAFDPGTCGELAGRKTVQAAIDRMNQLTSLFMVSGNDQEVMPVEIPNMKALVVLAANGCGPVVGAKVRFTVGLGGGTMVGALPAQPGVVEVLTDANGFAAARWTLGASLGPQTVTAALVTLPASAAAHPPTSVEFTANLSAAAAVAYEPKCELLVTAGATTVQAAIDKLCEAAGDREPGTHVKLVQLLSSGFDLLNDSIVTSASLMGGVRILCDQPIFPPTIQTKPVCFITLELPFPVTPDERGFWKTQVAIGAQPVVLGAELGLQDADHSIVWAPTNPVAAWLKADGPFGNLGTDVEAILARLTIKGNYIWSKNDNPRLFLDGETFGIIKPPGSRTDIDLSNGSGDGRRGGDFEMWFWLVRSTIGDVPKPDEVAIDPNKFRVVVDNPALIEMPTVVTLTAPARETTVVHLTSGEGEFQPTDVVFEVGARSVEVVLVAPKEVADRGADHPLEVALSAGTFKKNFRLPLERGGGGGGGIVRPRRRRR